MKNELAKTLKFLLEKKKISARTLARDTGMSISTVSDILNGRQPSLKNLQVISEYFGVSLDYLVNGREVTKSIEIEDSDFDDLFEGIVKIKISKLKGKK
ncbi:MAG: helix-turn-helix domain-containing protein [Bacteriovoracaceae bacterium]